MKTITKKQARQFILAKQGLIGPHKFIGKTGAYDYVRQAGCIQYDPVDVCGKNAELTLQARVKGFKKKMLFDLLYKDRKLIDYADKELSIWPTEDWPYFSSYRERSMELGRTFDGLEELKERAIDFIRKNGPVCSDSLPIEGEIYWHSSMHWSGNWDKKSQAARSVLEQLYTDGELIIHHKKGSRKYYDLARKHIDSSILNSANPCKDEDEFIAWRVLRRIGAVGLLWDKSSTAFLGIDLKAETRKRILSKLSEEGKICAVMVEGVKVPFYYLASDEELMQKSRQDDVIFGKDVASTYIEVFNAHKTAPKDVVVDKLEECYGKSNNYRNKRMERVTGITGATKVAYRSWFARSRTKVRLPLDAMCKLAIAADTDIMEFFTPKTTEESGDL